MTTVATAGPAIDPSRYFHGTFARLSPGDKLLPGVTIGAGVHFHSDHVYAVHLGSDSEPIVAMDAAAEWAAHAADLACTDPRHTNPGDEAGFHYASWREDMWPACLRVYEISPDGLIEPDPYDDTDDDRIPCVRMAAATVLTRINQAGEPCP